MLVERSGRDIDPPSLRKLRLDFPQLVILALLDECDQRSSLRLQSIGVHSILLPPFADIDLNKEIATAIPNVPQFKRHPDLMRRGQARLDFVIPSDLSYVLGVNHEVSLLLKEFGFPPQDVRVNIPLACDEAITNAIVHGNKRDPEKKVNVQIYVSFSRFRIRVRDQGEGFEAAGVEDPRSGDNVMKSGGRGVYLIKNIMDVVEYKDDGRVLELEKRNSNAPNNHREKNETE
jgi:serine/threonine-protein kinase RsbW